MIDYYETGKDELKAVKAEKSKHGPRGCNSEDLDERLKKNSEKEDTICKIVEAVEKEVIVLPDQ